MFGNAEVIYLHCSRQQSDCTSSFDKRSTSCVSPTPEVGVCDDPMELLRDARIRFHSTKTVLLAREQFMKNVWNCTRNGFGARKRPAERSSKPNVLYLSSGMPQGAQTTVFVVPEKAMALKLRVSSSENSHRSNHYIRSVSSFLSAETITFVVPIVFNVFFEALEALVLSSEMKFDAFRRRSF